MKFSRQREMIFEQVKKFPVHPTAYEVYNALKKDNPNLSLGTVYRNLNLLSDMGMLMKIRIADGKDRFDGRTDTHYHMVCSHCGKVFDVELDIAEKIREKVLADEGHTITDITLNLTGICRGCAAELPRENTESTEAV